MRVRVFSVLTLLVALSASMPDNVYAQKSHSVKSGLSAKEKRVRIAGAKFVQKKGQARVQEFQVLTQELFKLKGMSLPRGYRYVPKFDMMPQRVQTIFGTPDSKTSVGGTTVWHYVLGRRGDSADIRFSKGKVVAALLDTN